MIDIIDLTYRKIKTQNLKVKEKFIKPWGGYFEYEESEIENFLNINFGFNYPAKFKNSEILSVKTLIILPFKKLSWQYHKRRKEIWKVNDGKVEVYLSKDDIQRESIFLSSGEELYISKEQRHRIIGTDVNSIISEIWIHTDKKLSDENDIVRLQDDYGR